MAAKRTSRLSSHFDAKIMPEPVEWTPPEGIKCARMPV
jgi:hypothetical protein